MSEPQLVRDARALSSGTMSYLIGDTRYAAVDAVQADFIEFCQECPQYETWVLAWQAFMKVYDLEKGKAGLTLSTVSS